MHYIALILSNRLSAYKQWVRKTKRRPFAVLLGILAGILAISPGLPLVVSLEIEGDFKVIIGVIYFLLIFASLPFLILAWVAWRDAGDKWLETLSRLK